MSEQALNIHNFHASGYLILRQFFDPDPLSSEMDRILHEAFSRSSPVSRYDGIHFQYVPMMTANTPVSLSLLDRTSTVAERLLAGPVIPTRAKAVRYFGSTAWHVDSVHPLSSIGFMAYLEPLDAENGALRVLPGSHLPERRAAIRALGGTGISLKRWASTNSPQNKNCSPGSVNSLQTRRQVCNLLLDRYASVQFFEPILHELDLLG
jgi:hypothetical protein